RACTFEVGIHNTAVAITIAITVLGNNTIAIPAGIYTIVMYTLATFFGIILSLSTHHLSEMYANAII
ncbi:bile acid:sodium symporter family protein, partial [Corynebacterium diphtheriae]